MDRIVEDSRSASSKMSQFNNLLDYATSTQEEYPYKNLMYDVLYLILREIVQPKDALAAIKDKMKHKKFTTAFSAVVVLEYCVRHGDTLIHDEACSSHFLKQLREIVKSTKHMRIRHKILKLIEIWMYNFWNLPKFAILKDTQETLIADGFIFPNTQRFYSLTRLKRSIDLEHCQRCTGYCSRPICILPDHPICKTCYEKLNSLSSLPVLKTDPKLQVDDSSPNNQEEREQSGRKCNERFKAGPSGICCVCMENKATHIFVSCGHRCICEGCSKNLRNNTCPVCRCVYTSIIQVFDV